MNVKTQLFVFFFRVDLHRGVCFLSKMMTKSIHWASITIGAMATASWKRLSPWRFEWYLTSRLMKERKRRRVREMPWCVGDEQLRIRSLKINFRLDRNLWPFFNPSEVFSYFPCGRIMTSWSTFYCSSDTPVLIPRSLQPPLFCLCLCFSMPT